MICGPRGVMPAAFIRAAISSVSLRASASISSMVMAPLGALGATGAAIRDGNWFDGKPAAYEIGVVDLDLIMAVTVVQRRFRRRSAARRDWGDDEFLS